MHFIIGGAYNGKRKWVDELLEQDDISDDKIIVLSGRASEKELASYHVVVWSRTESWIEAGMKGTANKEAIVEHWKNEVTRLLEWEQGEEGRKLLIIGTDQSKGVVPMDKTARAARDVTGWCYQYTALKAERVTRVWYGIAEELKQKEESR
ncbi:hypothetical protein E2R51_09940 [Jeotgalibacillus sp. S-D1]|uniref:bifunctional adenosylcobinamide kinase/adenosylcobinamide-phosphate guanylyltransferase n=1 Tax=Jeotgalibacillus sp. S-D1 TaxID=2552189 RepID=UPI00105935E4|nr:bifunctional adenosylcobinamide kinase/adenosylcobinamide-phosphate guanylyltransferase [Jeotgalibacillus sp. S-D1]TDL32972.1 hypothetical protein E2R51_09940 [Jeotgalibacillus sp. S-D1]